MRVLFLSKDGDGLGMAYKLALEGNHVDFWIKNPQYKHALEGIIDRPKEWRPLLPKADLVICDMVGFSQYAELFQKYGKPFLSCNPVADIIELDRMKGLETFKRVGIDQPEYWHFKTTEECAAKLPEIWEDEGLVLKPFGNLDTGKTYVCDDISLAQWALTTYPKGVEMIVQRRVFGVEVSTEGWFNGLEYIAPFNHTFEEKTLMNDGVGKMTGCMGNIVQTTKGDKLCDATVRKVESVLKKAGYRGPVDVNCIVTKAQVFGLEFTCRFGYDAVEALMQGLREPMGNLLFETAIGSKKEMDISSDYLMSVRVSRDPYPSKVESLDKIDQDLGMPIVGLTNKDMNHVYLCDCFLDKGGNIKYAASDGVVLKATGFGRTIPEASTRTYKVISNIKGIDLMYRTDIGARAAKDIKQLQEWGWLN
jgi:phosphoribosylamine--glycine ligase